MESKKLILDTLDFWKYKTENNLCTPEEIESVSRMLEMNIDMKASVQEIADFYNVPETNVRATISRKLIDKPERKVMYPFQKFMKIIPDSWRKRR